MKAHRRAKAQQAYPSSKQAPMLFPLPDLKSERKESSYFPRITHELVCKTHCQALLFLRCSNSGILALQDFPPIP
ncbi:hypothetical protein V6N12_068116 [Hibiscus sabdariffa]|uniref:Uncharacterized protein n=1 Tax=Hibiscus sabdariffa TaxID=183260 RepID=A0ABR2FPQ0_9ROSI